MPALASLIVLKLSSTYPNLLWCSPRRQTRREERVSRLMAYGTTSVSVPPPLLVTIMLVGLDATSLKLVR